jgi:hypothetical protein
MMQTALSHGWKAQVKPQIPASGEPDDILWTLYAVRGEPELIETLKVVWKGDVQTQATYTFNGKVSDLYWRNRVLQKITGKPKPPRGLVDKSQLPFDLESPAFDVLLGVLGKKVTWVRRIDGEEMSARVPKETNLGKKFFRVYNSSTGRRILEWQDTEGFHAVGLDQIVSVG